MLLVAHLALEGENSLVKARFQVLYPECKMAGTSLFYCHLLVL